MTVKWIWLPSTPTTSPSSPQPLRNGFLGAIFGLLLGIGLAFLPFGSALRLTPSLIFTVFLQSIILGAIGFALGWRPGSAALALGAGVIALGTAGFAALGLLLGGTLRAEIVLALANLLWFVFAALYGAWSICFFVSMNFVEPGTKAHPSHSVGNNVLGAATGILWLVGMVHCFYLNRSWLRWRASARRSRSAGASAKRARA